ncbi:MAG TPA: response regulator transcription factor [Trebonia sp.]
MRVALAEDGLMREPLVMLLEQAGAEVTCATSTPDELLIYLARDQPDVVVTDLKMPPTKTDEGVQVAKWVKANYPDTGVLVLSAYNETSQAAQLVDSDMQGVGYLLKDNVTDAKDLYRALTRVLAGEQVVDPDVVERLMGSRRRAEEIERLSAQERKVLGYMAEGYTDGEIAELLSISARTASDHVRSIFQKLDIGSAPGNNKRVKAVLRWLRVDST